MVWATVRPSNEPSQRMLEKLSFARVKVVQDEKGELIYFRREGVDQPE